MGKHVFTVIVAIVVGASLLGYLFMYQVGTDEVAVVLTFGKTAEQLPKPGLGFRWPWPIQEVRRFDNRLHVHEGLFEETYTRDENNIITSVCIGWKIGDVREFNTNFGRAADPIAEAWSELEAIIRDRALQVLGRHDLGALVSVKDEELKYNEIEDEARRLSSDYAMTTYGIDVVLLKIKRLQLPQSVTTQVYKRMKTERSKEAAKIAQEGKQLAEGIRNAARSQRDQVLALAAAEAVRLRGEGDAEAAKYYKVFAENPNLHIYLRKIDALTKVTEENTTIILDTTMPPFDVLFEEPPGMEN